MKLAMISSAALVVACTNKPPEHAAPPVVGSPPVAAAPVKPPAASVPVPVPAFAAITPVESPPFASVKYRLMDRRHNGWPEFEIANLGTKTIVFLQIFGYAYDQAGAQVAHTQVGLSWNGHLEVGKVSAWPVQVGGYGQDDAPATATVFQLCYSNIKFDGDADFTTDDTKCPPQRPKQ